MRRRSVESLRGNNGVLFVANPTSCSIKAELIEALNTMDGVAGLTVRAIFVGVPSDSVSQSGAVAGLGIKFPVEFIDSGPWFEDVTSGVFTNPSLIVVHLGDIQAILMGEAALRAANPNYRVLPGLSDRT